jgi:hypothetical protein
MRPSTVKKLVTKAKPKAKAKAAPKHKTREQWLMAAVKKLQPIFKKHGYPIPEKLQVSCGWPHGHRKETIGQCFYKSNTADGTVHLFVSPALGDDGVRVLDVLVHELVHAAVGEGHGHRGDFKKLARLIGLEGPLTATIVSEGTVLHGALKKIHTMLGTYPHSVINYKLGKVKKDATWVRVKSTKNPEYTMAISIKNLKHSGFPLDPWGQKMVLKTAVRI